MAGTRRLRRHDEAGAPLLVQIAPEVRNPEIVAVADFLLFVDARQAEGQARVALDALRVYQIHVERGIRHDEVALARLQGLLRRQIVLVLVIGERLGDLPFQSVHREIHLGDVDRIAVFLLAIKHDLLRRVAAFMFDEVAGLHEHAARPASRIEHRAMVRLDHVDDHLHERGRRKELSVVMGFLDGKLGEKIFVDAPEHVA